MKRERKTARLYMRLTPSNKALLEQRAKDLDMNVNELMEFFASQHVDGYDPPWNAYDVLNKRKSKPS